jgi:hypothetical protein
MIFGEGRPQKLGQGYIHDPLYEFAREFGGMAKNIITETGLDMFRKPDDSLNDERVLETLKNYFVNESCDRNCMTESEYEEHVEEMEQLFENDKKALLEYTTVADKNPVIGMSFAVHKNILITCPFDKGAIQKAVAATPKFPVDLETRYLITPDGEYIDIWKDQNKITAAIDATVPEVEVIMTLPEVETTDVLAAIGASDKDNLSVSTAITEVLVTLAVTDATTHAVTNVDTWIKVKNCNFVPGYGDYDRIISRKIVLPDNAVTTDVTIKEDALQGTMMRNKFMIRSARGNIKAVKLVARKDASNGLVHTCSVSWKIKTDIVEIDTAKPFNVTIAPEEVKDIAALYNINQLTKVMSLINLSLENYKDDKIREALNSSWETLDDTCKATLTYDMLPRQGYYDTHISWRNETFMDSIECMVTDMLQVYNDPNVIITVFGRPDLIRKVAPVEWTYQSPANIGPVPLEFQRTVVTNSERVYQFISTRKFNARYSVGLPNGSDYNENQFLVILNPRNTDRIMYRIYDYQMYVSNEIRNASNPTLPAVHAFERWKFYEMQPVQGRVNILNPSGLPA